MTESLFTEGFGPFVSSQAADRNIVDVEEPAPVLSLQEQDIVRHYLQQIFHSQVPFMDEATLREASSQLAELSARSRPCLASLGFQGLNYKSSTLGGLLLSTSVDINKQAGEYEETANKCLNGFVKRCDAKVDKEDVTDDGSLFPVEVRMCAAQIIYSKVTSWQTDQW